MGSQRVGRHWTELKIFLECLLGGIEDGVRSSRINLCCVLYLVAQSFPTLWEPMDCSLSGTSVHENSPGKNTGVGYYALLQEIFPTQVSNPSLPYCRRILYHLSHQGNPKIPQWVGYPFFRGSSPPRSRTGVSFITGGFFTSGATREAQD